MTRAIPDPIDTLVLTGFVADRGHYKGNMLIPRPGGGLSHLRLGGGSKRSPFNS